MAVLSVARWAAYGKIRCSPELMTVAVLPSTCSHSAVVWKRKVLPGARSCTVSGLATVGDSEVV
jgi:hypothetical protein